MIKCLYCGRDLENKDNKYYCDNCDETFYIKQKPKGLNRLFKLIIILIIVGAIIGLFLYPYEPNEIKPIGIEGSGYICFNPEVYNITCMLNNFNCKMQKGINGYPCCDKIYLGKEKMCEIENWREENNTIPVNCSDVGCPLDFTCDEVNNICFKEKK